eukprot:evm.model.NODE_8022_length_18374_cov_27.942690.2
MATPSSPPSHIDHDAMYLQLALTEAQQGLEEGGIPIGAVLVLQEANGTRRVLGRGHNRRVQKGSAILHGETDCLEIAGRLPASVYKKCTMYTTLSPCSMCSGAILLFGISRVVVGENKTFMGAEDHLRAQGVEVIVKQDEECVRLMTKFIKENAELWEEDSGQSKE